MINIQGWAFMCNALTTFQYIHIFEFTDRFQKKLILQNMNI